MYVPNHIVEQIKKMAKNKKIAVKTVLNDIGLNYNTMSNLKTSFPRADNLAKIADRLDCSVDYLLGRTDNPQAHKTGHAFFTGDFSGNSGAIGVGNTITSSEPKDAGQILLLDLFSKLSPNEQAQLLSQVITKKFKETHTIQQKESEIIKYRIGTSKLTDEERKKIKEFLEFYECKLDKDYKSYMVFSVDSDIDIEAMLIGRGFDVTVKKLSD